MGAGQHFGTVNDVALRIGHPQGVQIGMPGKLQVHERLQRPAIDAPSGDLFFGFVGHGEQGQFGLVEKGGESCSSNCERF